MSISNTNLTNEVTRMSTDMKVSAGAREPLMSKTITELECVAERTSCVLLRLQDKLSPLYIEFSEENAKDIIGKAEAQPELFKRTSACLRHCNESLEGIERIIDALEI